MGTAWLRLASLGAASIAIGCTSEDTIPLVLGGDPLPAGLFIITPAINGAARLVAVDPATGAGLEHTTRQTSEDGGSWTAILLKEPLEQLGIAPGPLELGSGRTYAFDYSVKRAVAGVASVPFEAVPKDTVIPELGGPFKDVRSPAFPAPRCLSLMAEEIEIESPPIATAVVSGFATVYAIGQELYERGPEGLRPKLVRSGPPVVTTIFRGEVPPATAAPFVPSRSGSPGELAEGFVTASARTKLGLTWYAAVTRTPTLSTTLWSSDGFLDTFRPQITIPGVEVRRLAPVDGSPGRVYAQTARGDLLLYREKLGTVETLRAGTSTGAPCPIGDGELSPSYDCGALSFFDAEASLVAVGVDGLGPLTSVTQGEQLEELPLGQTQGRILSLVRGPGVLVSSATAAEVLSDSGASLERIFRGPAAYGLSDTSAVGGRILLDRSGAVFEILGGQACPVVLTSTVYRRVMTASGSVLLFPAIFAEPGSHRQRLAIIRTRP